MCMTSHSLLSRRALTVEIELHSMSSTDSSSYLNRKMITYRPELWGVMQVHQEPRRLVLLAAEGVF